MCAIILLQQYTAQNYRQWLVVQKQYGGMKAVEKAAVQNTKKRPQTNPKQL